MNNQAKSKDLIGRRTFLGMFLLWSMALCAKKDTTSNLNGYYTCPMHPQIHENQPGKCPICHMDLVFKKGPFKNDSEKHDTSGVSKDEPDSLNGKKSPMTNQGVFIVPISLTVPADAVLDMGRKKVVLVLNHSGKIEPRVVNASLSGGAYKITKNIKSGESIARDAWFIYDADANLNERIK